MNDYKIEELKEASSQIASEITNLLRQHVEDSPAISVEHLKKIITSQTSYIFVAKDSLNKIIGMVTMISVPKLEGLNKSFTEDLVVDTSHRRLGIGEALMKKVFQKAKEMNIKSISLTSKPSRIAANKLYQKIGFQLYKTNNYKYGL